MFGFLLGTACLVGLIWVVKGPRHHACRRWDSRHFGEGDPGRGWGGRALQRWLFERLDTTPGQERVMRSAMDDLTDGLHSARRELQDSRKDLARALRADSFDAEALGEVFAKHDAALAALRRTAVESLSRTHEVLDERQRQRLADLIESERGRRWHGPYRSHA
ncbi:MAG: periplasmic heavy metal sensor [Polyangiaceae bacterium]|nr:periplasmic heavy metal sensor [Myxococcales bacterium]MCC6902819.1 periplasmic heavy metal sensor [Polyangiaceae bacterium]